MILADVLSSLFTFEVMIAMMVGVVGGIIIGALPGLSATLGVSLLLPVTFGMNPIAGLVMLTALYTSAIYGGSITAVLIHTPGTAASAATAIDGYELTKQGQGMKAIGVATIASMVGGTVSALALLFLGPPLGLVSLRFGPFEYFFMGLFGVTVIASLAGKSLAKGIISGVVGLLLGTVGLDLLLGVPRFTFGSIHMEGGFEMAPAMIGLFSISQVLIAVEDIAKGKKLVVDDPSEVLKGSIFPSWSELKMITPTVLRSSILGTLIGIIPAAGATISSWVNYNEGKRFAKKPELYGKGSIEGVAASEAGNNSATGGALIPMLALGVPGSTVAAILMGGLMIHGMQPGFQLFTENANITYPIIIGFLLANILMGIVGFAIARPVARVSTVPMAILCPIIVGLSCVGCYSINNSFFEVYLMLAFGLVGYLMRKTGFAPSAMILGLILSPIIEANLRRVFIMCKGDLLGYFLSRPIAVGLMVLVIATLFLPIIMKKVNSKIEKAA